MVVDKTQYSDYGPQKQTYFRNRSDGKDAKIFFFKKEDREKEAEFLKSSFETIVSSRFLNLCDRGHAGRAADKNSTSMKT